MLVAVGTRLLFGATAQAAPVGGLKQYKVPTANSQPRAIVNGSDGNRWFTLGTEFTNAPPAIARITPAGAVTEFRPPCETCIVRDLVQGPGGILYYSSDEAFLGRITTAGTFLAPIPTPKSNALAGDLAVHGSQVWMTDFNNDAMWRYDIASGVFTRFDVPEPSDVVVDAAGIVSFAATLEQRDRPARPADRRLDAEADASIPRGLAIAGNGQIWFTARFTPQGVGRLNPRRASWPSSPLTNVGPQGIAASPDGSVWFTKTTKGNVARITNDRMVTEGKVVKGSEPFGITVEADGDPWYTMLSADKIGELQLR